MKDNLIPSLFASYVSSSRLALKANVSLAKAPEALSELPPTGAFYPLAVSLLLGLLRSLSTTITQALIISYHQPI